LIRNLASVGLTVAIVLSAAPLCAEDAAQSRGHAAVLDNPLAAHPLDEFAATRDRPLFTRGRRPPAAAIAVPVAATPPPPPPPPPKLALFGILVDAAGSSAVVRGAPSDKAIHVRVGDEIEGWKVARIGERQLVLSLDDQSVTFTMFDSNHDGVPADWSHAPPLLEVNAAGVLRAHRVVKVHH